MTKKTLKERHSQLKPIMKYIYFQKSGKSQAQALELMTHLEKAGRLVDFMLDTKRFPKPHDMYHYIQTCYKPSPEVIRLAHMAFAITDEMAARCCYLYEKKGKLSDVKLVSLTRIPGKEKMKPWIQLFEREDLRTVEVKPSFERWLKTTDSGKVYRLRQEFYSYAISRLMEDTQSNTRIVITKKWFPNRPTDKTNRVKE